MHKRKLSVGSVIGTIILGALMIALMIYTATRTVHFLQETFPASMSYVAYLALAAFDGGIIGWTIFATSTAEGALQRGVAYLMIFVDTLGVILTTVADTTTVSAKNGLTTVDPYMATVGMWGSIAIIVLNVVAIIVTHLVAPHHVRKFELENVHDSIHQLTMQHIRDRAIEIAPRIAAEHADHWVRQTIQDVVGSLPVGSQTRQIEAPKIVESTPAISHRPIAQAASRTHTVDPHNVKAEVKESKLIEKKPLWERIKGVVDFSIPAEEETPQNETVVIEEPPVEEETIETEELPENYLDWTDKQWKQAKDQLTKEQYDELFDDAFPPDGLKPTPKTKKKVSRRKVLGMEKQGE